MCNAKKKKNPTILLSCDCLHALPWGIGRGDALEGVPEAVTVSMVTGRTEIDVWTLGTLPADPVERRGVAAITTHPIVLDSCH